MQVDILRGRAIQSAEVLETHYQFGDLVDTEQRVVEECRKVFQFLCFQFLGKFG